MSAPYFDLQQQPYNLRRFMSLDWHDRSSSSGEFSLISPGTRITSHVTLVDLQPDHLPHELAATRRARRGESSISIYLAPAASNYLTNPSTQNTPKAEQARTEQG